MHACAREVAGATYDALWRIRLVESATETLMDLS